MNSIYVFEKRRQNHNRRIFKLIDEQWEKATIWNAFNSKTFSYIIFGGKDSVDLELVRCKNKIDGLRRNLVK